MDLIPAGAGRAHRTLSQRTVHIPGPSPGSESQLHEANSAVRATLPNQARADGCRAASSATRTPAASHSLPPDPRPGANPQGRRHQTARPPR